MKAVSHIGGGADDCEGEGQVAVHKSATEQAREKEGERKREIRTKRGKDGGGVSEIDALSAVLFARGNR